MKPLVIAFAVPCALLTGCMDERDPGGRMHGSESRGATLPSDAYYIGVPLPFRTVDDCIASRGDPTSCVHAVALCASGTYGVRTGGAIETGRYHLDDHHAVSGGSCHGGHDPDSADSAPFDFDVESGQLVSLRAAIAWEPDYDGRWKTTAGAVVDCAARPPRR